MTSQSLPAISIPPNKPNTDQSPVRSSLSRFRTRFSQIEDEKLLQLIGHFGDNDWANVAQEMGSRDARQCRERYRNYLDPDLKHGDWSRNEDARLVSLYALKGPNWNVIAEEFVNRSRIAVRNRHYFITKSKCCQRSEPVKVPEEGEKDKQLTALFDELVRPASAEGFSEMQFYTEFGCL